jgi:hypothetical protein
MIWYGTFYNLNGTFYNLNGTFYNLNPEAFFMGPPSASGSNPLFLPFDDDDDVYLAKITTWQWVIKSTLCIFQRKDTQTQPTVSN